MTHVRKEARLGGARVVGCIKRGLERLARGSLMLVEEVHLSAIAQEHDYDRSNDHQTDHQKRQRVMPDHLDQRKGCARLGIADHRVRDQRVVDLLRGLLHDHRKGGLIAAHGERKTFAGLEICGVERIVFGVFGNEELHDARVADNAVDLAARHGPERLIARRVVHQLRARVVLLQELLLPNGRFGGSHAFEHVIVVVAGVSDHDAVLNQRRGLIEVFLFARPRVVIHGEDYVDLAVLDGLAHRIAAIERLRFDGNAQIFLHDGKRRP